jgi:hypothetical protein
MASKFIKILFVLLFTQLSFSQNNLQFSRVVTESGNISCGSGCSSSSVTYTVPQGKVWKMEYITPTIDGLQLLINGKSVSTGRKETYTNNYNYAGVAMYVDPRIIWLKAGDSFYFHIETGNYGGGYFVSYDLFFSAIEFSIN